MWASGGSRWVLLGLPFVQAHRSNLIMGWFLYMRPAESGLSAVGEARQACSFGNWRPCGVRRRRPRAAHAA